MPREQTPTLSLKRAVARLLLAAVVVAAAALSPVQAFASSSAQSGRKTKKDAPATAQPVAAETQADKTSGRIASLVIVGNDTDSERKVLVSGYSDSLAKACEQRLKESKVRATITRGGRMGRAKAIELAKREQDAHVLWFEFMTRPSGLSPEGIIERVDYFLLAPRTAEMLATGQFRLKHNNNNGPIRPGAPLPRIPGVRTNVRLMSEQLREGGRELADRVRDKL